MEKVVLISGGSSGIGLGVVRHLSEVGGWQIISVSRNKTRIDKARSGLGSLGNDVVFLTGDISQESDCENVAQEIKSRFGKLHGLVNSAGTISAGGLEQGTVTDWRKILETNLTGTYLLTRNVLSLLKAATASSIVNISSVCSLRPCSSVAYSVSKAGTDMFTKCLAQELAKYNIRVNAINPGVVRSNLQNAAGIVDDYEQFIKKMTPMHPLGRVGLPKDIAGMVRFLLSDETSWVTGAIISVDGGRAL